MQGLAGGTGAPADQFAGLPGAALFAYADPLASAIRESYSLAESPCKRRPIWYNTRAWSVPHVAWYYDARARVRAASHIALPPARTGISSPASGNGVSVTTS